MIKSWWRRFTRRELELAPDTQPVEPTPSATLPDDGISEIDVPEHYARAIATLGEVAQHIAEGGVDTFMMVVQHTDGRLYKLVFAGKQDIDMERISVATIGHGKDMLHYMATLQGNAPPDNRSDREQ